MKSIVFFLSLFLSFQSLSQTAESDAEIPRPLYNAAYFMQFPLKINYPNSPVLKMDTLKHRIYLNVRALFTTYPNPVGDELSLIFMPNECDNLTWEISDDLKNTVKQGQVTDSIQKIDTHSLNDNVYYISVKKEGKPIATQKFIIIR